MKKTGVIFLFLVWIAGNCPGAASYSYLNNPAGARPVGMAEAFAGMPGNINGLYYNPASLFGLKTSVLNFSHAEFLPGVRYEYAGAAFILPGAVLGVSAAYVNNGTQERRDLNGVPAGEFTPYQFIPQVTLAAEMLNGLSLGFSFKMPYEVIDDYSDYKPFFDIGVNAGLGPQFYAGLSAQNIGTFADAPANLKAGLTYLGKELNLCLDLNIPYRGVSTISLGLEILTLEKITFRTGYRYKIGEANNTLEGLTAGFGVQFDILSLDYGYKLYDELGATHFISLAVRIN